MEKLGKFMRNFGLVLVVVAPLQLPDVMESNRMLVLTPIGLAILIIGILLAKVTMLEMIAIFIFLLASISLYFLKLNSLYTILAILSVLILIANVFQTKRKINRANEN